MSRRSKDWNEGLAKDLQDPKFAREFLLAALDEELPLQVALAKVIKAIGVKEFAKKVRMPSSNLLRTLRPTQNVTQETLNRLLKPFGLKLSVVPIDRREQRKKAA